MRHLIFFVLIIGLSFFNCNQSSKQSPETNNQPDSYQIVDFQKEKNEIQNLIQQVLIWSDTCRTFNLYPLIGIEKTGIYMDFKLVMVRET